MSVAPLTSSRRSLNPPNFEGIIAALKSCFISISGVGTTSFSLDPKGYPANFEGVVRCIEDLNLTASGIATGSGDAQAILLANQALIVASGAQVTATSASVTASGAQITASGAQVTANAAVARSGDAMSGNLNTPSLNGGPLAGFRNLLINANPIINQRSFTNGADAAANSYTLDRWKASVANQNISWTDVSGVRTVNTPSGSLTQVVEAVNNLGGVHTLSWTGTATARINGTGILNGAQVTLPPNTNITTQFTSGTFSQPQLESGPVKTPFERRPYSLELALCERYCLFNEYKGAGISDGVSTAIFTLPEIASLRSQSPTITAIGTVSYYNTASGDFVTRSPSLANFSISGSTVRIAGNTDYTTLFPCSVNIVYLIESDF